MSKPEKKLTPAFSVKGSVKDAQTSLKLWQNVQETGKWIAGLKDPELGDVGALFRQAMRDTGSRENVDLKVSANSVFNSFAWPPAKNQRSFRNKISYGPLALEDKGKLLGARVHEFIHAMQYKVAAVMHADPFNDASDLMLSPLNYVRRKELLEQDAYAKGAWLQSLAKEAHPDIAKALDHVPVSVAEFEEIRKNAPDLKSALADAALLAASKEGFWIDAETRTPARDLWHKQALVEYAGIIKARKESGKPMPQFVRIESRDIEDVGNSFGPNPFKGDNRFNTMPQLSAENRKLLDELNREVGLVFIAGHDTITTALEKRGVERETFIKKSYKNKGL